MDPEFEEDGGDLVRHRVFAGTPATRDVAIGRPRNQMCNYLALGIRQLLHLALVDQRIGAEQELFTTDRQLRQLRSQAGGSEECRELGA